MCCLPSSENSSNAEREADNESSSLTHVRQTARIRRGQPLYFAQGRALRVLGATPRSLSSLAPKKLLRNFAIPCAPPSPFSPKGRVACATAIKGAEGMSDPNLNELYWTAAIDRIVSEIEEYSKSWRANGPSEHVARAIIAKIKTMPVPQARGQQ